MQQQRRFPPGPPPAPDGMVKRTIPRPNGWCPQGRRTGSGWRTAHAAAELQRQREPIVRGHRTSNGARVQDQRAAWNLGHGLAMAVAAQHHRAVDRGAQSFDDGGAGRRRHAAAVGVFQQIGVVVGWRAMHRVYFGVHFDGRGQIEQFPDPGLTDFAMREAVGAASRSNGRSLSQRS